MFRVPGLEVDIALQIIGKKSQSQLERNQTDGVVQVGIVVFDEKVSGQGEIAVQDGPAQIRFEAHRLPVLGFFAQRIAARPQAVADIIMHQAGLDGVQVHHADGLPGGGVHHDVVDLGIAVNRAEPEPPLRPGLLQDRRPGSPRRHHPQAIIHFRGRPGAVVRQDLVIMPEVARRYMKPRQGVGQMVGGQIAQEVMEHAQGITHFPGVRLILNDVKGLGGLNKA